MKLILPLVFSLAALAQPITVTISQSEGPPAPVDKVKLEAYLRHLEVWPDVIKVKIDDPVDAIEMPGLQKIWVHLAYNDAKLDQSYYVSRDGRRIMKGEVFDLSKSPFQANIDKIQTEHQPSFNGPTDAPVTLAVFGDFECPYCKEESSTLRQNVPSAFAGKVRVVFMDFPLETIHPWARAASVAGRCVLRQSEDAFWKYHDWIYAHQQEISKDNYSSKLTEWAGQSGVDPIQLGRCVDGKTTETEVDRTEAMGRSLGVDGTPTLYLNGRKLMDQYAQWGTLQQLITLELDHQAKLKEEADACCVLIPKIAK